jgi:hypothetical protein
MVRFFVSSLCKTGLLGVALFWAGSIYANQDFRFRVLLDDKEIGHHHFRVAEHAGYQIVDIRAEFDVKFFKIPVYSYDHGNREVWEDGCLDEIVSRTDDNGTVFLVDGEAEDQSFKVITRDQRRQLKSACVMTFAYWNREFLQQSHLLNAQTGEYLAVSVDFEGTEQLKIHKNIVPALRYRLRNQEEKLDITIWYEESSGKWLSLESKTSGGRLLRYLPVETAIDLASAYDRITSPM